jgi:rhodanese-related sulfurtransferase
LRIPGLAVQDKPMKNLSVEESYRERQSGQSIPFVDVRTPSEFRSVHAEGAVNHPLESLDADALPFEKSETLHLICQSGGRSAKACQKLEAAGYESVANVEGGTSAWQAAGFPVVEGKKAMSLERQVRVAAGSLVVIGAAIGYFVHIGGYGLSAFVGAGLVFAGLTDTCAMGMLIAKMPWNRG